MAQHIDLTAVHSLPKLDYNQIRPQLLSGDLFFASGDYLFSKVTQKVTHSPWSHVGIIFRFNSIDRVLLLESVENVGVRFAPLSKYLGNYENNQPYRGRAVVARSDYVTPEIAKQLAEFGMDLLTRPYDLLEMAKILARVYLRMGKKQRNHDYICSELVYECFLHANKAFNFNHAGFISPEDIWIDASITPLGRIL